MNKPYQVLDLCYTFQNMQQHLYPVVLFGSRDVVLVDCGYPGSLKLLQEALSKYHIPPESITKLLLTHQDDDHIGAAAELKEAYPTIQIMASGIERPYLCGEKKNLRLQQAEQLQKLLPMDQQEFGNQFCQRYRELKPIEIDTTIAHGECFDWGGGCEIIATPGHTPGHISIRALDHSFFITGDAAVLEHGKLAVANPEYCLDIDTARRSLAQISRYKSRTYICFHGGEWPLHSEGDKSVYDCTF